MFVLIVIIVALSKVTYIPKDVREIADKHADFYGLDTALVCAVIKAESGFDGNAVSGKGACGLMQLLPSTFDYVSEKYSLDSGDIFDKDKNVEAGCAYLNYLFGIFSGANEALAAYNAGEGMVREWLKNENISPDGRHLDSIPYPETANYVKKVRKYYNFYKGIIYESSRSKSRSHDSFL